MFYCVTGLKIKPQTLPQTVKGVDGVDHNSQLLIRLLNLYAF